MGMDQHLEVPDSIFYSLDDVGIFCNLSVSEVQELLEYGVISSANDNETEQKFSRPIVLMLQSANRLRKDYDLDLFTIVLIMDFLKRIHELEQKILFLERFQVAYTPEM
jgi:chaperone modulatory protein CbpM